MGVPEDILGRQVGRVSGADRAAASKMPLIPRIWRGVGYAACSRAGGNVPPVLGSDELEDGHSGEVGMAGCKQDRRPVHGRAHSRQLGPSLLALPLVPSPFCTGGELQLFSEPEGNDDPVTPALRSWLGAASGSR